MLYTINQAAEKLGMAPERVLSLVNRGRIKGFRSYNNIWHIAEFDLEQFRTNGKQVWRWGINLPSDVAEFICAQPNRSRWMERALDYIRDERIQLPDKPVQLKRGYPRKHLCLQLHAEQYQFVKGRGGQFLLKAFTYCVERKLTFDYENDSPFRTKEECA